MLQVMLILLAGALVPVPSSAAEVSVQYCIDLCADVQKAVHDDIDGCSRLLDLLNECKGKGADVGSAIHDVELCKRYLEESDAVLGWSCVRLEEIQRTVSEHGEIRDRLLVEAMDGENGLMAGISLLEDARWNLKELSDGLNKARSLCRDFLDGKLEKDRFLRELNGTIPDLVGYARGVRDSAYKFGSVVDASWTRVENLVDSWERERSLEETRAKSRLRALLLTLLAAVLVPLLPPGIQGYISALIGTLATLLPLVLQLMVPA